MRKTKLILIAGAAALAAALASCGQKPAETTAAETTAAETAAEETTAAESEVEKPESYGTVELCEYIGIPLEVTEINVTDEDVSSYINALVDSTPVYNEVDRAAELGDTVNIDYVGKKDGVEFEGGNALGYDLELGSHSFIDGFEDGLVGAKKGDKLDLNLTFPEQYHAEDLAGQAVVFEVTVNAVKEKTDAELNDAWVEDYTHGGQKTVEEYRKVILDQLTEQQERSRQTMEQNQVLTYALENSTFEVMPEAIAYEAQVARRAMEATLMQYGMTIDSYVEAAGISQEDIENQLTMSGENAAKLHLFVDAVAEKEGFEISEKDYQAMADYYGVSKELMVQAAGQDAVDFEAMYRHVGDFLIENAEKTVVEPETEAADAEAADAEASSGATEAGGAAGDGAEAEEAGSGEETKAGETEAAGETKNAG